MQFRRCFTSELLPPPVVVVVHNVQQVQHLIKENNILVLGIFPAFQETLRDSRNIIGLARLHWIGIQGSCQHLATAKRGKLRYTSLLFSFQPMKINCIYLCSASPSSWISRVKSSLSCSGSEPGRLPGYSQSKSSPSKSNLKRCTSAKWSLQDLNQAIYNIQSRPKKNFISII